ncbi:2OG-Fe(II) oxygenase [Parathalassolituus penaei]|uniref:2OG-Fe(II) oxygenase n=1 Tax=Parathalassolituus penaei TaxID=2997323 RepID=A0A9X3IQW5_9GAMM|nr:2OG-Fe(II) oxygenase [Parathalassolituus penaei]MCY0964221.1 2OG-Fe(II) oxygenase [Parathalassolituus penaei]
MTTDLLIQPVFTDIANDLRAQGYSIVRTEQTEGFARDLLAQLHAFEADEFHQAGTGRQQEHQLNSNIRRDRIRWLSRDTDAEVRWLDFMDDLQRQLNRQLLLGLFSHECHFAHYRPGDFYRKHVDAFKGQANRILTSVFYLNDNWQADQGGELVMYRDDDPDTELLRLVPTLGTLVFFLSEDFPHEVLPATSDRYSIAGWFRLNSSRHGRVDPPR